MGDWVREKDAIEPLHDVCMVNELCTPLCDGKCETGSEGRRGRRGTIRGRNGLLSGMGGWGRGNIGMSKRVLRRAGWDDGGIAKC